MSLTNRPADETNDEEHVVDLELCLRPADIAAALDAVERRRAPWRYGVFTLLGVAVAVLFVVTSIAIDLQGGDEPASAISPLSVATALFWFAFLVPFVRYRNFAWMARISTPALYAAFTLESFSRRTLKTRAGYGAGEHAIESYPLRTETPRLFVFARAEGTLGPVIPKQALSDAGELDAFRRVFAAEPPAAEVVDAVRAFADEPAPDAIDFLLVPPEQLRANRLLLRHSSLRWLRPLLVLGLVTAIGYVALQVRDTSGAMAVAQFVVVLFGTMALARWRVHARLKKSLKPARLEVRGDGLKLVSSAGTFDAQWSELAGYLEDDRIFVVSPRPGFGFVLPKRAVPEAVLGRLRANLSALGR